MRFLGRPTLPTFGPSPAITCPVGAIAVSGGASSNIQAAIDANSSDAVFCLSGETFSYTSTISVIPKGGQTFIGQYGCVLDGSGMSTADNLVAAFKGFGDPTIDRVTIKNIVFKHFPWDAILTYRDESTGWTIERCEFSSNRTGIEFGKGSLIQHNYIHDNIGISSGAAGVRGGGYAGNTCHGSLVFHNDISSNGLEQKIALSSNVTFRSNNVTHNAGDGIWFDTDFDKNVIADNTCNDNGRDGISLEDVQGAQVSSNVSNRNQEGILVFRAQNSTVTFNTFTDNSVTGISLFEDLDVSTATADLQNNTFRNNTIQTPSTDAAADAVDLSFQGTTFSSTPYTDNTKNNNFNDNTYLVSSTGVFWFFWAGSKNWSGWQALPQDSSGTMSTIS